MHAATLPHLRLLATVLLLAASLARAQPEAPFTPAVDRKGDWSFTPDTRLPNVLILGDSISIGYTRAVREQLRGKANVFRPMSDRGGPVNCGDTPIGLRGIDAWLAGRKWDVIHFNWGLWDLCYRNPAAKTQGNRDKVGGRQAVPVAEYEANLEKLVATLRATGAVLIWASTTVVPENEVGRFVGDDEKYNAIAARVMARHGVATDDLFALTRSFAGRFSSAAGDVHFTPEGYARIGAHVASAIEQALARRR